MVLPATRVVSEDEAERALGEHVIVDREDLVRQRVHIGGVDRHQWVEEVGEANPPGLGGEAEGGRVAGEGRGAGAIDEDKRVLVGLEEH